MPFVRKVKLVDKKIMRTLKYVKWSKNDEDLKKSQIAQIVTKNDGCTKTGYTSGQKMLCSKAGQIGRQKIMGFLRQDKLVEKKLMRVLREAKLIKKK